MVRWSVSNQETNVLTHRFRTFPEQPIPPPMAQAPHPSDLPPQLGTLARDWAAARFDGDRRGGMLLHNDEWGLQLAERVAEVGTLSEASTADRHWAAVAAYLEPVAYLEYYATPEAGRRRVGERFAQATGLPATQEARLLAILGEGRPGYDPAADLLADARLLLDLEGLPTSVELAALEREMILGEESPAPVEQWQTALDGLLRRSFRLRASRQSYQSRYAQSVLQLRKNLDKARRRAPDPETPAPTSLADLESGVPVRAAQTLFRSVYRNHINLSAIADQKANIMISVNAILISVLITFISYRNWAETRPVILLPVVLFIISGLASLVFAVLSARPKVTRPNAAEPLRRRNLLFFGNFVDLDGPDYETAMTELLLDGKQLYGNLVRDLYQLGRVLDRKYRYLHIAYNIFLMGMVVTVVVFLVTLYF